MCHLKCRFSGHLNHSGLSPICVMSVVVVALGQLYHWGSCLSGQLSAWAVVTVYVYWAVFQRYILKVFNQAISASQYDYLGGKYACIGTYILIAFNMCSSTIMAQAGVLSYMLQLTWSPLFLFHLCYVYNADHASLWSVYK